MNKILVEFHIPAAGLAFDVYLPVHMYIGEILPLLAAAAQELSSGAYCTNGNEILCDMESGMCLDANKRIRDSALKNGSKLFII